jgi:hypothetical protein
MALSPAFPLTRETPVPFGCQYDINLAIPPGHAHSTVAFRSCDHRFHGSGLLYHWGAPVRC